MARPGPKPSGHRLGHIGKAKRAELEQSFPGTGLSVLTAPYKEPPAIPRASPNWKPQTRSWFNSARHSAHTDRWQASDWMTLVVAAEALDRFLRTNNGAILASFRSLSSRLGFTVTDRIEANLTSSAERNVGETGASIHGNIWQSRIKEV
jgi:hypothetical protein